MTECDQRFNEAKVMFIVLVIATLSVSLPAQHTHTRIHMQPEHKTPWHSVLNSI